jgi:hypothetical protein
LEAPAQNRKLTVSISKAQHPFAQDRAHVVAVAVLQIVDTHPNDPVRAVAAYLRDEFSDIERQLINDLKISD